MATTSNDLLGHHVSRNSMFRAAPNELIFIIIFLLSVPTIYIFLCVCNLPTPGQHPNTEKKLVLTDLVISKHVFSLSEGGELDRDLNKANTFARIFRALMPCVPHIKCCDITFCCRYCENYRQKSLLKCSCLNNRKTLWNFHAVTIIVIGVWCKTTTSPPTVFLKLFPCKLFSGNYVDQLERQFANILKAIEHDKRKEWKKHTQQQPPLTDIDQFVDSATHYETNWAHKLH